MAPPRSSASSLSVATGAPAELSQQEGESRKRVTKACDRCRLKKIKCDGQLPCSRCSVENSVCRYGERKATSDRRIPPGYVEYLEEQQQLLVKALKKCWSRIESSQGTANDDPPVHTILENLGVLAEFPLRQQRESGFMFEEDLDTLRERCEAEAGPVSSASTTTSHVASAEPTPARLSPEPESSVGFPFQQSSQQRWSPSTNPYHQISTPAIGRQQQLSPGASTAPPLFLPQTASAPSSVYESPADLIRNPQWQPNALAHVHSEPTIVSAPTTYWHTSQQQQQQQQQQQEHHHHHQQWESEQHQDSWQSEQRHGEPHYSTVDPADLMLATTTGPYFQSQEAWDEFFRRMQERHQR